MKRWLCRGIATVCVAIPLAACGEAGTPEISRDLALDLARRADGVAAALEAGACTDALAGAQELAARAERAEADGRVPTELRDAAHRLVEGISCPPPPPSVSVEEDGDDEDHERGKGKKRHGDDDDD